MSDGPVFRLLPLGDLHAHEEVDPREVKRLAERIRARRSVDEPVWVAEGSGVILNGHHRVAALRAMGAERVPAWVIDYTSDAVTLERWKPGPPIPKADVVRRALAGDLFPPKTTRHVLTLTFPHHSTPIAELGVPGSSLDERQRRASARSRPPGARAPGSG